MPPGGLGLTLFMAQAPPAGTNVTEPTYDNVTAAAGNASDVSGANIDTYDVNGTGSYPFMSDVGIYFLSIMTSPPDDASLLEEAVVNPEYKAVKDNISYHQQSVSSFLTFLWAALVFFCLISLAATVQRVCTICSGTYSHKVTPNYMVVFVVYIVVLGIFFVLMAALAVLLVGARDSMTDSVTTEIPAVLASTFQGLRAFVNLTVAQIALKRRTARMPKVESVLGVGFDKAFKAFVASSTINDMKVPVALDCSGDPRFLGRALNTHGNARQGPELQARGNRCAHLLLQDREQLFEDVSQAVAAASRNDRREIYEFLSDYASMMDESDCNVAPSLSSINQLENAVNGFEERKGAFGELASDVRSDLYWLNAWYILCLCLLVVGLLVGVYAHNRDAEPHDRSGLSHLIGFELMFTGYAFTVFVIWGTLKTMFLTIESTLGHTYLCGPYLANNYVILDDGFERLWPTSNRSHLLSRITPSEVMESCQNDSASILDLGPKPSHGRVSHRHGVFIPRLNLQNVLHEMPFRPRHERSKKSFLGYVDTFGRVEPSLQEVASTDAKYLDGSRAADVNSNTRSDFSHRGSVSGLNKAVIEEVLLPMLPSYYNHFVRNLVSVAMQPPTGGIVAGRCSILRALLVSFMDVVSYTYVLELLGYWATLLVAIILAVLAIPFCFMLSKYFYRTRRPVRIRHKASRTHVGKHGSTFDVSRTSSLHEAQASSSIEQFKGHPLAKLLQMYARTELPPGMTRRIVAMSAKDTVALPPFGPLAHQHSSYSAMMTQPPQRIHAVSSSTSIVAGNAPMMVRSLPSASIGVVAPQAMRSALLAVPFGATPAGSVGSSVHRADSFSALHPHCHTQVCTNMTSSSVLSLPSPAHGPLMHAPASAVVLTPPPPPLPLPLPPPLPTTSAVVLTPPPQPVVLMRPMPVSGSTLPLRHKRSLPVRD
ncbi:hypothetical protein HPB48_003907 [Haemaphysalis longicornis]|uniref:Uncharacterized protein n=1 Tax=Haemaphysalis longicornis TaxID=44386 RepID=A0A9J6FER4_HAELO|nr:hypothetical protein HPB48_003907 [Haemaphysalis longicornis]